MTTKLRRLRLANDLTQEKVAELLGIKVSGYSKIETGKNGLKLKYAQKLSEFYKVTVDEITKGVTQK